MKSIDLETKILLSSPGFYQKSLTENIKLSSISDLSDKMQIQRERFFDFFKSKMPVRSCFRMSMIFALSAYSSIAIGANAQTPAYGNCGVEITAPATVVEALDRFLVSVVDPDGVKASLDGYATGGVLSVKAPNWQYIKSIGTTAPDSDTPIACDMPYQIGSATKMMTGTVMLQLHEEGLLSIDDLLLVHMPGYAKALPNGEIMTLRQLATHTAGVFSYTDPAPDGAAGIMAGDLSDPNAMSRGYAPFELVDFAIQHGKPYFPPGEEGAWYYSNTGYVILGEIIERITGKPLASVFEERIFGPLGMTKTYLWNDIPKPAFGLAKSYYTSPFEIDATDWNLSQGWAAGAVISTAGDMTSFISALLEGHLFKDASTLGVMQEVVPTNFALMPSYGIGLGAKAPGLWGHAGQTLGYTSDTAYYPEENISIVMWANSARSAVGHGSLSVSIALKTTGVIEE